jgi:ankyrin repeat protein
VTSAQPHQVSSIDQISQLAANGCWQEIAEVIRGNQAILVAEDRFGATALHRVAPFGAAAPTIRLMIANGAKVDKVDNTGTSPLGRAISGGSKYGLTTDENVKAMLEAGADLRVEAQNGQPPLHWAILERKPSIVRLLLEAGADPAAKNVYGEDAYKVAAETRDRELQELLRKSTR